MPNITEYGDIVFTTLDEWGRRKIDSLLEDGTKIIVVEAPPPPTAIGKSYAYIIGSWICLILLKNLLR